MLVVPLWSDFSRIDVDGGRVDLETQEPVAWHAASVDFRGGKFPKLRGCQRAVGEIRAGAGRIERCFGYVA